MENKDKLQVCKVVAQAILADIQITDEERALLDRLMDRYELDDAERKEVMNRNLDDDPGELAKEIEDADARNELLVELALTVAVDGEIAKTERAVLDKVAEALEVSEEDLEKMIEAAIS
jgi:uncharacterized tellurite resistance protein B-like protein